MRPWSAMLLVFALAACRKDDAVGQTATTRAVLTNEVTVADQGQSAQDLAILGAIRRTMVTDPRLSPKAKHAVVVVRDGVVTLRGDVSQSEHDAILTHAAEAPEVVRIEDLLSTEP